MDDDEFLAIVERCRTPRGALDVVREAARLVDRGVLPFGELEKRVQTWSEPVAMDRAIRFAVEVIEDEDRANPNIMRAKALLSALLLATGERAAEHLRGVKGADRSRA